jgi:hypothetical protein
MHASESPFMAKVLRDGQAGVPFNPEKENGMLGRRDGQQLFHGRWNRRKVTIGILVVDLLVNWEILF